MIRRRARKLWRRIERLRWAVRRPVGLVLGYHRIAVDPADPYGNCVSPAAFCSQVETLIRLAQPVPLATLASDPAGNPRRVALAFDDGYVDFAENALPILREHGVPATLYVVSGALDAPIYWWDRFSMVLADCHDEDRFWRLHDQLASLDPADRDARLNELVRESSNGSAPRSGESHGPDVPRPMTTGELLAVAADPLVEIGAHSRSHPSLAGLPADRLAEEVEGSRMDLEALLGRPVSSFAYPHGRHSRSVRRAVREAGFTFACASTEDALRPGEYRFTLPRCWVPDLGGSEFEEWLRQLLPEGGSR